MKPIDKQRFDNMVKDAHSYENIVDLAYSFYEEVRELKENIKDLERELDQEIARCNSFLGY